MINFKCKSFLEDHIIDHSTGPVGAKLNWLDRVHDCNCVHKHTAAKGLLRGHQCQSDALRSLLRPFLDPSSALSAALGRLDSDSIWHVHMRRIYGLVAYLFEHLVCFCTNTKLVPDSLHTCIKRLGGRQRANMKLSPLRRA